MEFLPLAFPAAGTFLYLSYPWNSKTFIIVHNAGLQLFSMWTFVNLFYRMWELGLRFEPHYYFGDARIEQLVFYFYLSKYYEYLDTFILYAKGKEPIFLQKFHHVGAVICWHIAWYYRVDQVVYPTLVNAFIHSIMYLYYLLTVLKIELRHVKHYITALQMLQFMTGFAWVVCYFNYQQTWQEILTVGIFSVYNLCLFVLFGKFIKDTYLTPKPKLL